MTRTRCATCSARRWCRTCSTRIAGTTSIIPARSAAPAGPASADRVLQGGQGRALRARERAGVRAAGTGPGTVDLQVPQYLRRGGLAAALALHALAAPFARIIAAAAGRAPSDPRRAWYHAACAGLTEDAQRRAVPGNRLSIVRHGAGRSERVRHRGRRRQLELPQVLARACRIRDRAALASTHWRHGRARARATNASTSEPMVSANSGSNTSAASGS